MQCMHENRSKKFPRVIQDWFDSWKKNLSMKYFFFWNMIAEKIIFAYYFGRNIGANEPNSCFRWCRVRTLPSARMLVRLPCAPRCDWLYTNTLLLLAIPGNRRTTVTTFHLGHPRGRRNTMVPLKRSFGIVLLADHQWTSHRGQLGHCRAPGFDQNRRFQWLIRCIDKWTGFNELGWRAIPHAKAQRPSAWPY